VEYVVLEMIDENEMAFRPDGHSASTCAGPAVRILDTISANKNTAMAMRNFFIALGKCDEMSRARGAGILGWLLRAWQNDEPLVKFTALFTALEMVLSGEEVSTQTTRDGLTRIRKIVEATQDPNTKDLISLVDHITQSYSPSITSRFEALARRSTMPKIDSDIRAFRKFNALRVGLVHRGDKNVRFITDVGPDETRDFEDLVERYVCFSLFGDIGVYNTRKPRPGTSA